MAPNSEIQKLISQPDCTVDSLKKICTEKGLIVKDWKERLLITYPKCDTNGNGTGGTQGTLDFNDPFVRECRGIILTKDPLEIVCYSMDKLYQSDEFSEEELEQFFDDANWVVEELLDGSLLKLYWYNDQWTIATNRCIEAKKARWANYRSFYDLFQESKGELDLSRLNKRCSYSFVLCHPENRIVTNHQKAKIVHVATRDLETLEEINEDVGVEKPLQLKMDWDTLQERLQTNPFYIPGYVLKTKDNRRIVMKCENYKKVKKLKGNSQDLTYRYLQLQRENETQFKEFLSYFPEFVWIDTQLETLAREVHQTYMEFFVKREKSRVNRDLWELMRELHILYLRTHVPTSLAKVRQHLKSYPLDKLSRLINMKNQ